MVWISKIYTKSGDSGDTGLGDGTRVPKDSLRIEAIGQVDELNALIGTLLATTPNAPDGELLRVVQNALFDIGGDLCIPIEEGENGKLRITAAQAERLEQAIDKWNDGLEPLRSFILPGGSVASGWLHLARTVCRRAERAVVALSRAEAVNPPVIIYLNRLSDLLFVLARVANNNGRDDVLWVPGANR
jgi:cob(I)alamin adenosyltransferase